MLFACFDISMKQCSQFEYLSIFFFIVTQANCNHMPVALWLNSAGLSHVLVVLTFMTTRVCHFLLIITSLADHSINRLSFKQNFFC